MGALSGTHIPVLLDSAIELLDVQPDGIYVDGTVGAGGHAEAIARRLESGRLLALDRDPFAVALATSRLRPYKQVQVQQANYRDLRAVLAGQGLSVVNGILIDAGVSSMQLDNPSRGFSFQEEGPLDMRMDTTSGPTAAQYLADIDEPELIRILRDFADVPRAPRIAAEITKRRADAPLETTQDLVQVVCAAFPFVNGVPQETRQVFQAIRIAVNEELQALNHAIETAIDTLVIGGRLVCITFHSGEDRIVKRLMQRLSRPKHELHPDGRTKETIPAVLKNLTRKPVTPDNEELRRNPRAASAKLRAVERVT